jgi:hypothetical protein
VRSSVVVAAEVLSEPTLMSIVSLTLLPLSLGDTVGSSSEHDDNAKGAIAKIASDSKK